MKRVAIIGAFQTKHDRYRNDIGLTELIFETTYASLKDANFPHNDIDSVVFAAHDLVDGRGISSMVTATAAGAYMREEIRIAEDGLYAVLLAKSRIMAGHSKSCLVVSWSKCSESNLDIVTGLNFDPFYYRPVGMNETVALALQAAMYQGRFGPVQKSIDALILRERGLGALNPYAHLKTHVTSADLRESPIVAYPLRKIDLPPRSDGACALVMVNEERASDGPHPPIWVEGMGWCTDSYYLGERELSELPSLSKAADMAYRQAGINKAVADLDIVEIHAPSSYFELICFEEMRFCNRGESKDFVNDLLKEDWHGPIINASGGALCANPYTATGLIRLVEVVQRLRECNGTKPLKHGLAHGTTGMAGQSHCVIIVSRD